jgi:hypothetical protein
MSHSGLRSRPPVERCADQRHQRRPIGNVARWGRLHLRAGRPMDRCGIGNHRRCGIRPYEWWPHLALRALLGRFSMTTLRRFCLAIVLGLRQPPAPKAPGWLVALSAMRPTRFGPCWIGPGLADRICASVRCRAVRCCGQGRRHEVRAGLGGNRMGISSEMPLALIT